MGEEYVCSYVNVVAFPRLWKRDYVNTCEHLDFFRMLSAKNGTCKTLFASNCDWEERVYLHARSRFRIHALHEAWWNRCVKGNLRKKKFY